MDAIISLSLPPVAKAVVSYRYILCFNYIKTMNVKMLYI